jgi:SAM-dependent methyltransferase
VDDERAALVRMASAYWVSGVVYVLARFNIADHLAAAGEPCGAAALAEKAGVRADPLGRFLRAGASLGLLASDGEGRYRLTPLGEALRGDLPGSARASVVSIGRWQRDAWRHDALDAALVGPGPGGWRAVHGEPWFDWLAARPEEMAIFQKGLGSRFAREPAAFAAAYDFARFRTAMDVGGGNGKLLSAVLAAAPHLEGVLLDLPAALAAAARGEGGPLPRTRFVAHDFFQPFPARADLILMKRVIHDWEDPEAVRILSHARAALEPGGRVVVLDAVVEGGDAPDPTKLLDLHMMLLPGGRQRSREEFAALFEAAGLRLVGLRPVLPDLAALEGSAL